MKILSAKQLREWEQVTMTRQGVSTSDLMLRAANVCADWFESFVSREQPIALLCGTGHNGGDGLVLTRLLHERGYGVKAFFLRHTESVVDATIKALQEVREADAELVEELPSGAHFTSVAPDVVIVDAVLGLGATRPLEGWLAEVVQSVSRLPNAKVAIDMPTGAGADMLLDGSMLMKVQHTLTFSSYKRALLHPEVGQYAGIVHVLDIGLDADFLTDVAAHHFTLDRADAAAIYRPREPFSHKGTYGTAFLIGGSKGLVGALGLATMAASRSGAGKVRALVPEIGYTTIQVLAPEAMCRTSGQDFLEDFDGWQTAKGVGLGPGLGTEQVTADALAAFLEDCTQPVVLDADALTIIGQRKELLSKVPAHSILTPHPKEFERLFGKTADTMQRAELARLEAMRYNVHIVLKDKHTMIATPGGACWYNLAGNAGLATGGSGDVLCGIIAGLLSAGYGPCEVAMLGVYLHAAAGDFAAAQTGMEAVVAGDLVAHLGDAFRSLGSA